MKITAWRIFKKKHRSSALTGEGARRYGGRWNSRGVRMIYTSASPSLAVLEIFVHLQTQEVLEAYLLAPVTFDDSHVTDVPSRKLPSTWRSDPAPAALQKIGDEWARRCQSAVLRVPSAIIATEFNYLLNPIHRDLEQCAWGKSRPFKFDPRFVK